MDWSELYEDWFASTDALRARSVEIADVGCGFGGLLVALAPKFSEKLILGRPILFFAMTNVRDLHLAGMEIRLQVTEYVSERINALRKQHSADGAYQNIAVIRANSMKFLPNFFSKHQVGPFFSFVKLT